MKFFLVFYGFLITVVLGASAQFGNPFEVNVEVRDKNVVLDVTVPEKHYLYAENLKVLDAVGSEQEALKLPATAMIDDPNSGKPKPVYDDSFTATFRWDPKPEGRGAVHVQYWGCNDEVCFIPQTKVVELKNEGVAPGSETVNDSSSATDWQNAVGDFEVKGSAVGYKGASDFLAFLDQAENGGEPIEMNQFRLFLTDPVAFVRESGLVLALVFILIGGLLLNLTPCVLPMIPINLAIIGAGARAGSKKRGFALGAVYGLGIALVYGLLGVLVVLTGSQFGTIQANPWFNLVIAVIFIILGLAMFDVLHIDFSRFQSKVSGGEKKQGSFLVALSMGSVSALLAGACVAPVVIAVLLLATYIHEANPVAGLILPFVLGLGMALPWPFAGAGLSFLPKPGKWMEYVKYAFGVGIILFALYYAQLSYRAFLPADVTAGGEVKGRTVIDGATNEGLAAALKEAEAEGRMVFMDFWASWCKNCKAMDKSTFKDEVVKARLKDYLFVKYVAEDPTDPETQAVMKEFGVQGLPTFVVLAPKP